MSLANSCLSCGAPLGRGASKCRCGWKAAEIQVGGRLDCFNAPYCTKPGAIYTDRYSGTKGVWQNFCVGCEHKEHQKKSQKWCEEMGLITTRQKIDFCRAMAKKMFRGVQFGDMRSEREAGQDDEEIAA
jgi:hypothetical protein